MNESFTPPGPLNTAVLFLVFNRPDTTAQVFEAIRQARPPRLYVAADGPREGREGEAERVAEVREIATAIDWPCEVKTLFRDENLGCKHAVSGAIDWFFQHEEQGIILEDDCLPSQSFFWFSELMLKRHQDEKSIWMISGFNPRNPGIHSEQCFLSKNPSVWGWASWRDRWKKYDVEMPFWSSNSVLNLGSGIPRYVYRYYRTAFDNTKNGSINTWDYQLTCLILQSSGFVVKPYANLISNIGAEGTHSHAEDVNHFARTGQFIFSDSNDCKFEIEQDQWFYETRLRRRLVEIPRRILNKVRRVFS